MKMLQENEKRPNREAVCASRPLICWACRYFKTMPIDYTKYPSTWHDISRRIRFERAKNKCEWCGAENYQPHPETGSKVVLTVAHLGTQKPDGTAGDKHDKLDVRDENLAALCQRCHLNFDRDEHLFNSRRTRAAKRGQMWLGDWDVR